MNRNQWNAYRRAISDAGRIKLSEVARKTPGTLFFGITPGNLRAHSYIDEDSKAYHVVYDPKKGVVMAHWEDPDVTTVVGTFSKLFPELCDATTVSNLFNRGLNFPFSEWKEPTRVTDFHGPTLRDLTPADRLGVDVH